MKVWRNKKLIIGCMISIIAGSAYVDTAVHSTRGELLYQKHCNACHTQDIHWREKRLAVDWKSLNAQVDRWQGNMELNWNAEDIVAVSHYLNSKIYHFSDSEPKGIASKK